MKNKLIALLTVFTLVSTGFSNTVTVTDPTDTLGCTSCLRALFEGATANDTIDFSLPMPTTITLTQGQLFQMTPVVIIGPGGGNVKITTAGASNAIFTDGNAGSLSIYGIEFFDCASSDGGAINNFMGILTVDSCNFHDNYATNNGGAISGQGTLTVNNCLFNNNTANNYGGAIYQMVDLNVTGSIFSNNTANVDGGAIYNNSDFAAATNQIQFCDFVNDSSLTGNGGALNLTGAEPFNINQCTYSDCYTGGSRGGAIYSLGINLFLNNTDFTGNFAAGDGGAMYCEDVELSGINCVFSGNKALNYGGGIEWYTSFGGAKAASVPGDFNISLYHFVNDTAGLAGGGFDIYGGGNSSVTNSTFEGCYASNGGGFFQEDHDITFDNCTFSGNHATNEGGAFRSNFIGTTDFLNCTVVLNSADGNTGGLHLAGGVPTTMINSIVALNSDALGTPDIYDPNFDLSSLGYNLIGDSTGFTTTFQTTDFRGGPGARVSPKVFPIQDNGGGIPTHQLWSCSQAIDNGNPGAGNDANGNTRDASPDIGASEWMLTGDPNYEVINNNDSGIGSLRYGIENTCADTITFNALTNGMAIQTLSSMATDRDIRIIGNGSSVTLLDGSLSSDRAIIVSQGDSLYVSGIGASGYSHSFDGGVILNESRLFADDLDFSGNNAFSGAGIYSNEYSTVLTILNSNFSSDTSSFNDGGAVRSIAIGDVWIEGCTFSANVADYAGALSISSYQNATVRNSDFTGNMGTQGGGAIAAGGFGTLLTKVENCNFIGNSCQGGMGRAAALFLDSDGQTEVDSCQFVDNRAQNASAIFADLGKVFIKNSSFENNKSSGSIGAVHLSYTGDTTFMENCAIIGDTATFFAGIFNESSNVVISRTTISGNVGGSASAIRVDGSETDAWTRMSSNTLVNNEATTGELISMDGFALTTLELDNNLIAQNLNPTSGNSFSAMSGSSFISNGSNFIGNGDNGASWIASDTVGTSVLPIDPMINTLAYNEGSTWSKTHEPQCESPIIDAGNATSTDQYGNPIVGSADIGAYERQMAYTLPTAILTGSVAGCGDGTYNDSLQVDFTGDAPFNFSWYTGTDTTVVVGASATTYIYPDSAGTYQLIDVSDASCPAGTVSGTSVVADSNVTVTAVIDILPECDSVNGQLTAIPSGSPGPFEYNWSNGDVIATADTIGAGYHIIQITDQAIGCVASATILLSNATGPSISVDAITPVSCPGAMDGAVSTTVSGNGPFTIQWTNGENTENMAGINGGYYIIQAVDVDRCMTLDSVFVFEAEEFSAFYNVAPASCGLTDGAAMAFVQGGTPSYSYNWSSGSTNNTVTSIGLGIYSLTVTDGNGCVFEDSVFVGELGAPTMVIDSIVSPDCGLTNGEVYITANSTGTITYDWNSGAYTTDDITGVAAGNYILTLTDGGCTSGFVVNLPSRTPDITEICLASVDTASNHNVIVWEEIPGIGLKEYWVYRKALFGSAYEHVGTVPFDSLSVFVDTVANTDLVWWNYKLRTVDSCGSASALSDVVNHKTIHLNLYPGVVPGDVKLKWSDYEGFNFDKYYINEHTDATGWTVIDSVTNSITQFTTTLPGDTTGLAYLISVSTNDCAPSKAIGDFNSSRSNKKSTIAGDRDNSVDELEVNVDLYPNPTNGLVSVQIMNGSSDQKYELRDISGKLLQSESLNGKVRFTADLSKFESGTYLLTLSGENYRITRKIVKH